MSKHHMTIIGLTLWVIASGFVGCTEVIRMDPMVFQASRGPGGAPGKRHGP